jgi:hypothetical protein
MYMITLLSTDYAAFTLPSGVISDHKGAMI